MFTAVCVHIGWVKCRAPYLAVCHVTFTIGYPILTFYITELNFFSLNMTISRNYNYFGDMTLHLEMLFYVTQCDFFNHSLYTIDDFITKMSLSCSVSIFFIIFFIVTSYIAIVNVCLTVTSCSCLNFISVIMVTEMSCLRI